MVKTLLRSSFREIRQSLGRFLAILAIVGLGVGFFAGLRMCQPEMIQTGRDFLDAQSFHDFQLMSTLGYTQEDVDAFAALDGIASAQGAVFTDFMALDEEGHEHVLKAHSLVDGINVPHLTAGRMPEAPNECLGDARSFSKDDIGKAVTVSPSNDEDTQDLLAYDSYTLVGLMFSPAYLNYERGTTSLGSGSVDAFIYVPEEGFDTEAYFEIYLSIPDPAEAYSEAYDQQIDAVKDSVKELNRERAKIRFDDINSEAMAEIADGEKELQDGWEEYRTQKTDALKELDDAHQKLLDGEKDYEKGLADLQQGRRDYEDGLQKYQDGLKGLEDAEVSLQEAQLKLQEAEKSLREGEAGYEQMVKLYGSAVQIAEATRTGTPQQLIAALRSGQNAQLNAGVAESLKAQGMSLEEFLGAWEQAEVSAGVPLSQEYLDGVRRELEQGRADYEAGRAEYDSGKAEYDAGLAELQSAKQELDHAKAKLDSAPADLEAARRELDDGWQEYDDGVAEAEKEFADAEAELQDGEKELQDAKLKLEDLKEASIFTLTRKENAGYVSFDNDASIVAAISMVFPVFFFMVAALVCMTTMTRMVDEQRTQIGVLKAMGYSNGQIMGKYLFYSGSAAVVGSAIGYALGSYWLPWVIWEIYGIMYGFAPLSTVFDPALLVVAFAAALLCSMGATYFACRKELRLPAAELIRPKAPKAGRRVFLEYITPLWKRLSFLRKVSLRNVFRYRSRLIMMVLGIGGCTALLATGFGIRDSIKFIGDDQFKEITIYDYSVNFTERQDPASIEKYLDQIQWEGDDCLLVNSTSVDVTADGGLKSVFLVSSYDGTYDGFIDLHDGERHIEAPKPGEAVLNVGLAEKLDISAGDTITVSGEDVGEVQVTVSDICDNYVQNYIYIHPQTFKDQAGKDIAFKTLYLKAHEGVDKYAEGASLSNSDMVGSVTVNQAMSDKVDTMLARMDYIVLVVVLCAAALAFIVLYNLTNINITERIREIATIKVLGFYRQEVSAYVFREINILSWIGSAVGLLMGKALHMFVMSQIQIDSMFFPCRIAPLSYLFAVLLTILFTWIISAAMRPKLSTIDMAESLKSIE